MNRYMLTALAVIVLGGVVALVMALRSDKSQAKSNGKPTATATSSQSGDDTTEPRTSKRGDRPSIDTTSADTPEDDDSGTYYRDDGTVVRDHRGGDRAPLDKGATSRPRGLRQVDPETIVAVRNAVRPHVNRCADAVGDSALGEAPRIQGEVHLSIKDNQLMIDGVDVQLRDIDEGSAPDLIECVKTAVGNIALDATGHPDVDDYILTLPFDVRR